MVSALESRLSGAGSRPGRGHCVGAQVYKRVLAHLLLERGGGRG